MKDGEIYAGFDTGFVFGEVNADYVMWVATMDKDDVIVFQSKQRRP